MLALVNNEMERTWKEALWLNFGCSSRCDKSKGKPRYRWHASRDLSLPDRETRGWKHNGLHCQQDGPALLLVTTQPRVLFRKDTVSFLGGGLFSDAVSS
jgi:hypothetical protein